MRDLEMLEIYWGKVYGELAAVDIKLGILAGAIKAYRANPSEATSAEVDRAIEMAGKSAQRLSSQLLGLDEASLPEVAEAIGDGK